MNTGTLWGAAAISIAVVSWFFYRVIVPKSWKEWARAGVVQAFIIAFYAESERFSPTGRPRAIVDTPGGPRVA